MKWLAIIVSIVVVAAIVAAFITVGTPNHQRLLNFDQRKVSDLQNIQGQIIYYWQQKGVLPSSLDNLKDNISGYVAPVDPQSSSAYEYKADSSLSFNLCANFNLAEDNSKTQPLPPPAVLQTVPGYNPNTANDNWAHAAGRVCFTRTIDPQLYKPAKS